LVAFSEALLAALHNMLNMSESNPFQPKILAPRLPANGAARGYMSLNTIVKTDDDLKTIWQQF
jgi:hypothetical protein